MSNFISAVLGYITLTFIMVFFLFKVIKTLFLITKTFWYYNPAVTIDSFFWSVAQQKKQERKAE
jgi:hypothetical protein